jgi:hypothetical protein
MAKRRPLLHLPLRFGALQTAADGRGLAVQVLEKMETYSIDARWPWSLFARYRPKDTQQDNVVLRCIEAIQKKGTVEALAGFCAVMTDYIGQGECAEGHYFLSIYEEATEREISGKPGPWPTLDDVDGIDDARNDSTFQGFVAGLIPGKGANHA